MWCWIQIIPLYNVYQRSFSNDPRGGISNDPHGESSAESPVVDDSGHVNSPVRNACMRIIKMYQHMSRQSPSWPVWAFTVVGVSGLAYVLHRYERQDKIREMIWKTYIQLFWMAWSMVVPTQYLRRIEHDQHWMVHDAKSLHDPVAYGKDAQHSIANSMIRSHDGQHPNDRITVTLASALQHHDSIMYEHRSQLSHERTASVHEPVVGQDHTTIETQQHKEPQKQQEQSQHQQQPRQSQQDQKQHEQHTITIPPRSDDPVFQPPIPIVHDQHGNIYFDAERIMQHEHVAVGMDKQRKVVQLVDINSLPPAWACMFVSWSNVHRRSWWTWTCVTYMWLASYMWLDTLSHSIDHTIAIRVTDENGQDMTISALILGWIGIGILLVMKWYRMVQRDHVDATHSKLVFFRIHYVYLVMGTSTLAPFVVCWMLWNAVKWLRAWDSITIPSWFITLMFLILSQMYWFVTQTLVQNMSATGGYARFVMVCQIATKVFQYLLFGMIPWSVWFPVQVAATYIHNAWMTCGGYEWLRDVYMDWSWHRRKHRQRKRERRNKQASKVSAKAAEHANNKPTVDELHPLLRRWSSLTKWERVLRVMSWKYNIDTFLQDVMIDVSLLCLIMMARYVDDDRFRLFFAGLSTEYLTRQWITIIVVDYICVVWTWRWMRKRFMEEWACADVSPKTLNIALQRCKLPSSVRAVIMEKLKRELPECFGANLPVCPIPWYKMAMHEIFHINNLSEEEKRLPELQRWYAWREHVVDNWCSFQQLRDHLKFYLLVLFWCIGWMTYIRWLM